MTDKRQPPESGAEEEEDDGREEPLFRPQVLAEQQSQWLGRVLLAPSISHTLFALFGVSAAAAVLALLFFGDYTRKERIGGWLIPQQGLVQIYSPMAGYIAEMSVDDGAEVEIGDTLMVVSTDLRSEALGGTQQEVIRRLRLRRTSLESDQQIGEQLFERQRTALEERIVAATEELEYREREVSVQRERVALAEGVVQRLGRHRDSGAISNDQWVAAENERLDQLMRLRQLQREVMATERQRLDMESELANLPLEHRKAQAQIGREIDALEQQLAEAESRRRIVLSAPQSGTVTALQVEQGNDVKSALPLLSIVPAGSELEARLYIPTRAIGFIEEGQSVLLRYRAFPYQKFGHHEGTIARVSRSTVNPAELSPQLRRASSTAPGAAEEPVYPVTVRLLNQSVNAYGREMALQPGMEFEADVLIENRRLIEWVLEPLYSLTGKMRA